MPMIDFSVVVFPAPFRPSSVTTSPVGTSKLTPCSTWDSPYHAWRSVTPRSGSGIPRPHVGLHHLRVARHRGVIALGEDFPARQHGDRAGERGHHAEVVLYHQYGPVHRDLLDERG